ncbi:hypothetical protein [Yoonia sp. 2307UL14-13]|uniref:hypothetical protein n=1 Tax=Yoonia sp. 2307UL14-13 TaxID=3126506 RepID=UPI0030AC05F8
MRFGVGAAAILSAPMVNAQETVFGVEQGFEFGRNTALTVPESGDRTSALTRLSYGLTSATRTQELSFGAAGAFRFEEIDGEQDSGFEDPEVTLAYSQEATNGSFDLTGRFARSEIDTLPGIADLVGDDGTIDVPEDLTDLFGTGQRTSYAATGSLVIGRDRAIQFTFDLGATGVLYEDVTDPDLVDTRTVNAGLTTALQFSKVTTGTVGLRFARTEEEDALETERDVRGIDLGMIYEATPRATLDARIGAEQTITTTTTEETETDGLTGGLGLEYEMPNGTLTATLDAARDVAGDQILTARVGRELELPAGALSTTIGVTRPENEDIAWIGTIDWTREFPTGLLQFRLDRSVTVDTDADTRRRTLAGLLYAYEINRVSDLSIGITHVVSEESAATARVERTDLVGVYNYALTENWDLSAGLGLTQRDEDGVGQADSAQISLSIGREFRAPR